MQNADELKICLVFLLIFSSEWHGDYEMDACYEQDHKAMASLH